MATLAQMPGSMVVQARDVSADPEQPFWAPAASDPQTLLPNTASPNQEHVDNTARKRDARRSLPAVAAAAAAAAVAVDAASPSAAPGILDRRKSTRPSSIRVERFSTGGTTRVRSAKGLGPKIPIIASPTVANLQFPQNVRSLQSPALMANVGGEGDSRPASASFQDAPETASDSPTTPRSTDFSRRSGNEESLDLATAKDESVATDGKDTAMPLPSQSSQATGEKELSQEGNPAFTSSLPPNSDQAPMRGVSPSKRTVPMPSEQQNSGDVTDPSVRLSPESNAAGRTRSISPNRMPIRPQSPPKWNRTTSGDLSASNSRTTPSPQPPGLTRNASTRIGGFLSRMGSIRKPAKSPPVNAPEKFITDRRNTSHSIASITSNGGENLATIDDDAENPEALKRRTLQDQFQSLRMQEELLSPGPNGQAFNLDKSKLPADSGAGEAGAAHSNSSSQDTTDYKTRLSSSIPPPLKSPALDPSLPPGTAAGLTAGPAEEPRPVNWDLWQAVVYEGPAAVARTSGEELNRAIASGIPAAIRGVVWQVLADSKSPELEDLYRTLKARGAADIEQEPSLRPTLPSREASQVLFNNGESAEKESDAASSRSSIHSEESTPATSTMASQTTPPPSLLSEDPEVRAKLQAEKAKREAAALTKLEKAIKRDLGSRTSFSKYTQAAGLQDGLFGLCKAYALFDEGVGYAQGINFIAMPLLFNTTEEEAFTLLVRLMSKYDVRSMFTGDLAGLHLRLYQFERLLEDHEPALYCHLRRRNVAPQLYATQWFLTLFAYRFPLQLVLRVYDLIFSQGLPAILRFGLMLMRRNRDALLEMKDMGQLTNFLKEKLFDVYIDKSPSASSLLEGGFFGSVTGGADKEVYRADEMVRDACDVEISEATLAAYTTEWEESQRQTQEREAELEHLRVTNTSLTSRVKSLEDRTQEQDHEHVTIAGDVVRIKVENDKLLDENEGLKMKVEELQRLVDTQPAEIEAKFREEMSRVLERNSAVQSENRVLKEEQEEMEKQLVDIKMRHAETQQDHETLTRKWANVQAMLNSQ